MTARFATTPIGTGLTALDGGLTLTTTVNGANPNRSARSDIAHSTGTHGAEFVHWGDADLIAAIGVMKSGTNLEVMVGNATSGIGWRLDDGTIHVDNAIVATGIAIPDKGTIVGVRVLFGTGTVEFYAGDTLVHSRALAAGSWYFAASLGSAVAGEIACAVNAGQWIPASVCAAAGWGDDATATVDLRLSDIDTLTEATDTPAHARYEGIIDTAGMDTYAAMHFWPWGGDQPTQGGNAQVRLLDAGGLLDALAGDDIDGVPVEVRMGTVGGTLASSTQVGRYASDHLEVVDDGRKILYLRDAHDDLDKPLSRVVFLPSLPQLAGRPVPVVIGAVASVPALAAVTDGSVAFLCDAPLAEASLVMDRGDPFDDADWALDPSKQQLLLANRPLGPVTADVSSIGVGMTPATLTGALAEIFARVGIASWQPDDSEAIDAATGYAGIGYYTGLSVSAREALQAILPSYGAWWYRDTDGVIRIVRAIDPDAVGTLAFDLIAEDLAEDLLVTPDTAPNLTRRMAYRPNAYIHSGGDLVTDLDDVPPARRIALGNPYQGQAYSAVPMAARYRHADSAPPLISTFWLQADAQTEINRVCSLYAVPRFFYRWHVTGDLTLAPKPGDVGRITYPRYGLAAGLNVQVRDVQRNPATGDVTLTLWGA